MHLVIVESPSKAKTINNYLGRDFKVLASLGHIADLPSKSGSVLPDEDFKMIYVPNPKAAKYVKDICDAAKQSDAIYLATDPDREGEAIAWHIYTAIQGRCKLKQDVKLHRVVFNEITKQAIQYAIKHPRELNDALINAQQARRALDYLVGFTLSPLLWRKMPGCKSAGRVQSVALRMICEREETRENFVSQEYWDISGIFFGKAKKKINAKLTHAAGSKLEKFSIIDSANANAIANGLRDNEFVVEKVEKKQQSRNPAPPFITSTLQQEASRKLGFNAKKTMQIAQKLYEGVEVNGANAGLITYMRTDGVTIAQEALENIRHLVKYHYGQEYLPDAPRTYTSKVKNAQEAHEAIRPTNMHITPDQLERTELDNDYVKVYRLIWQRTAACQMSNVILDTVSATISDDKENKFRASGSSIFFDGFYKVYREGNDDEKDNDDESMLPRMSEGEVLTIKAMTPNQHFTEPLPRFTEASLVKKLEELGIGRPSTYASIISVLQERDYIALEKKMFCPQQKGRLVNVFLVKFFPKYLEYDFTADLEDELDQVACGELNWKELLQKFWIDFNTNIETASQYKIADIIDIIDAELGKQLFPVQNPEIDPRKCTTCNEGRLGLRFGKFGAFVACSNYPTCTYTRQFLADEKSESGDDANFNNQLLGHKDDNEIYLKKGPYGWYVQSGNGKEAKRVGVPSNIDLQTVNIEIANNLLSLPKLLGQYKNQDVLLNTGKYGPYVKVGKTLVPIKTDDIFSIVIDDVISTIQKKLATTES